MTASGAPVLPASMRGLSLIEVVLGLVLVLAAVAAALSITSTASSVTAATTARGQLDVRVHRTLDRIARELVAAREDSLDPDAEAPLGASALSFQRAVDDGAGGIAWSSMRRIESLPSPADPEDGIDNDGNGLVDDREIWLVRDFALPGERRSLLTRHVASFLEGESSNVTDDNGNGLIDERGLSIEHRDGVLVIRITLQAVGPDGDVMSRTAEMAVQPRN
jgi:hypothetical protein